MWICWPQLWHNLIGNEKRLNIWNTNTFIDLRRVKRIFWTGGLLENRWKHWAYFYLTKSVHCWKNVSVQRGSKLWGEDPHVHQHSQIKWWRRIIHFEFSKSSGVLKISDFKVKLFLFSYMCCKTWFHFKVFFTPYRWIYERIRKVIDWGIICFRNERENNRSLQTRIKD